MRASPIVLTLASLAVGARAGAMEPSFSSPAGQDGSVPTRTLAGLVVRAPANEPKGIPIAFVRAQPEARPGTPDDPEAAVSPASDPDAAPKGERGCALLRAASDRATAASCAGCHGHTDPGINHPVEVDYAASRARAGRTLRSPEEAVRRGAFLPGGRVQCVSCHDRRSPWAHRLAIPPGAKVGPAARAGALVGLEPSRRSGVELAPGSEVGRKPLCTLCHAYGD